MEHDFSAGWARLSLWSLASGVSRAAAVGLTKNRVPGRLIDGNARAPASGLTPRSIRRLPRERDRAVAGHPGPTVVDVRDIYESALRAASDGHHAHCELHWPDGRATSVDVARWLEPPTAQELALLSEMAGPVLDVGCGPGRHTIALTERGVACLGVDVLPAVVRLARRRGAEVIEASVFERLPAKEWRSALLLDGNIGIGADPAALMRRLRELLHPRGQLLVELDSHETGIRTHRFELGRGQWRSRPFRWTLVGSAGISVLAAQTGYHVEDVSRDGPRSFAQLSVRTRARATVATTGAVP